MQKHFTISSPGRVINLLDDTLKPNPDLFTSYSLSNSLLEQITAITAKKFAPLVLINGIALGMCLRAEGQSEQHFSQMVANNLLKKSIDPDELSRLIEFLANSHSMTGQIIRLSSENN